MCITNDHQSGHGECRQENEAGPCYMLILILPTKLTSHACALIRVRVLGQINDANIFADNNDN